MATAKTAGCKYITLTTRHHDGYSLYDTCGLNTYDAPHSCGRDLNSFDWGLYMDYADGYIK